MVVYLRNDDETVGVIRSVATCSTRDMFGRRVWFVMRVEDPWFKIFKVYHSDQVEDIVRLTGRGRYA